MSRVISDIILGVLHSRLGNMHGFRRVTPYFIISYLLIFWVEYATANIVEINWPSLKGGQHVVHPSIVHPSDPQKAPDVDDSAPNTAYNEKRIRIPGFIVPLEYSDELRVTEFLLVPYAGACIHTPPPAANQIIRVAHETGAEVYNFDTPVWVEGILRVKRVSQQIYLVDGETELEIGYQLTADVVKEYSQTSPVNQAR